MRRLRDEQVEVIAFGYQGEGEYMKECATHYFSPDNAQDIRRGLNAIAAEVGDMSDVVLDDATRARMQVAGNPTSSSPAPASPTAAPALSERSPAAAPQTVGSHRGLLWKVIIAGIVCYFLFARGKRR